MLYNRFRIDNDMVYSIDYFQIDFGLGLLSDNVLSLLFGSFDFEKIRCFGVLDCNSGLKHFSKYDLHWWQFGGFHVEVWPRSDSSKRVHWFLRMKFNPNKNSCNPALINVFRFLLRCGWVNAWHFSRVDYALDVQGPLSAFYVLSRKSETSYASTRYYGVRGSSGYLRVYDKRLEQKSKFGDDIGFELTRFEWEQRGNRDLDFTFDVFSRMDFSGLDGGTRVLRYVSPEFINQAINEFSPNYRSKLKKQLFSPITVKKELFRDLLDDYIDLYSLSGLRAFTDAQLFEMYMDVH